MKTFQVSYKLGTLTRDEIVEAETYQAVLNLFDLMSVADVVEIRETRYTNPSRNYPRDDKNYIHAVNVPFKTADGDIGTIKIPKAKKGTTDEDIKLHERALRHFDKSVSIYDIKYDYRYL
jgi:hypothetical protein